MTMKKLHPVQNRDGAFGIQNIYLLQSFEQDLV